LLWCGEAVGREADTGSASGNGFPGELGLTVAGESFWGSRPPAELGWQSRSCFLPGGDDGEGVTCRKCLEADRARERHDGSVDDQPGGTLARIVIVRVDVEARLVVKLDPPAAVLPPGPRGCATTL
jgi:hypothetical protein